mgnify:CR=1 FL=1
MAGDAALSADAEDDSALAAALDRLQSEPALRRHLGEAGIRRAERYRWAGAAQATLAIYRSVLGGSPAPEDPPESGGFPRDVFTLRGPD